MAFTKVGKPKASETWTGVAKPRSPKVGIYNVSRFGQGRYGNTDGYTKVAKPKVSETWTGVAKASQ